jgi:RNA polymerase sigma-70 factor (ECF subfamily)
MDRSDAELMRAWQRGEVAAFAALVTRWQQPLARFLGRYVGRADAVPDLCQDVFLRAYQAGSRYRETGAFSAWLYRIALNVVRDAGRRRRREPMQILNCELRASAPSSEAVYERHELANSVTEAIAELPDELRLVLVLRHYEAMNFEEIARLTGTPASTLKSRFAVALNRLRIRLREFGNSEKDLTP